MVEILKGSAATANSEVISGNQGVISRIRFQVVDEGSWSGSIKVNARILGRGKAGDSAFSKLLPITNLNDSSVIAAATGATAAGLYEVDVAGLEVQFEHTRSAGSVSVYGKPLLG